MISVDTLKSKFLSGHLWNSLVFLHIPHFLLDNDISYCLLLSPQRLVAEAESASRDGIRDGDLRGS